MSLFRPLLRPARGARARRRWASVAALAVAVATPAVARVPFAQAAPSDPAPAFASSFETGQRPLDWTSTVESAGTALRRPPAVHRRGVDSCHVRRLGTQNVADPDPVQDLLPQVLQEDARPHRSGIGHSPDQVHVVPVPVEHEGDRRTSRAASDDGHP